MTHLKGSMGWLMASHTVAYFIKQADLILNAKDMRDGEFALVIRYALDYWNIEPQDITDAFSDQYRLRPSDINGWAVRYMVPTDAMLKKKVLSWIANKLKQQAAVIQKTVEDPVKISA